MTTYVLTVTSLSGRKINATRTEDHESIAVYSKRDLDKRLKAAATNPDLRVHWRVAS